MSLLSDGRAGLQLQDMPDGAAVDCRRMPELGQAHMKRLRKLWSYGRPVHVGKLDGYDMDLIVHGLVQTSVAAYTSGAVVVVTKLGLSHLNEARQLLVVAQRPHHELGQRLALHLQGKGFYTWENVEFSNPDRSSGRSWGVVRPDVMACMPALKAENTATAIYEVKVSRSDFCADLANPLKREAYSDLAEAVYYCCPDGLIQRSEMPDGYGLLVEREPGEFVLQKRARRRKSFILSVNTAMTLMVKRQMPIGDPE